MSRTLWLVLLVGCGAEGPIAVVQEDARPSETDGAVETPDAAVVAQDAPAVPHDVDQRVDTGGERPDAGQDAAEPQDAGTDAWEAPDTGPEPIRDAGPAACTPASCDDGNPCTVEVCTAAGACVSRSLTGVYSATDGYTAYLRNPNDERIPLTGLESCVVYEVSGGRLVTQCMSLNGWYLPSHELYVQQTTLFGGYALKQALLRHGSQTCDYLVNSVRQDATIAAAGAGHWTGMPLNAMPTKCVLGSDNDRRDNWGECSLCLRTADVDIGIGGGGSRLANMFEVCP